MRTTFAKFGVGALIVASTVVVPASAALSGPVNDDHRRPAEPPRTLPADRSGYNIVTWDPRGEYDSGGLLELGDDGFSASTHPWDLGSEPIVAGFDFDAERRDDSALHLLGPFEYDGVSDFPVTGFDAPADDTGGNGGNAGLLFGQDPPAENAAAAIREVFANAGIGTAIADALEPAVDIIIDIGFDSARVGEILDEGAVTDCVPNLDGPPPLSSPGNTDAFSRWDDTVIPKDLVPGIPR